MIVSFKDKDTASVWRREAPRGLKVPLKLLERMYDRLRLVNAAEALTDFYYPPSNRFEALKGDRKGQYSIRIDQRWRVCFRFSEGQASDVEIVDYH